MARGVPAYDNTRPGKTPYGRHNRKPGVAAARKEARWRRLRRRMAAWLKERLEL